MRPADSAFVSAAVAVTGLASFFAFSPDRSGGLAFWAMASAAPLALGAIAVAWASREDFLRQWLSPRWGDFTRGLVGALALVAAAWLFVRVFAPVGSPREVWLVSVYGQVGDPRRLEAHAPSVAAVVIVVAIAEEIVWRGVVTQLLAERVGSRVAWLWAAGLYALACSPSMWALRSVGGLNPVLVVAAVGGGLLWGAMARWFGNLVPSILAHAAFDWVVIMMLPLWGANLARA